MKAQPKNVTSPHVQARLVCVAFCVTTTQPPTRLGNPDFAERNEQPVDLFKF
jgi:hypothetical protein